MENGPSPAPLPQTMGPKVFENWILLLMGPKVIPFISKTAPNSTEIVSIYEIIFLTRDDVVIDKIGPSVYVVKRRLLTNGPSVPFG